MLVNIIFLQLALSVHAKLPVQDEAGEAAVVVREALNTVLGAAPQHRDFTMVFTERGGSMLDRVSDLRAPWGLGVFEVAASGGDNKTRLLDQLSHVGDLARSLRQESWSVTVVVVSDDPAFLTTFAEWSLKGRLLVWSTRLLVFTSLPLHRLHQLRKTLAMTNSMFLHITYSPKISVNIYIEQPYSPRGAQPVSVATWSPPGPLRKESPLPYFPEKFSKLSRPRLSVTRVVFGTDDSLTVDDPEAPGEKNLIIFNPENTLIETIAKDMNFTIKFVSPPDEQWGIVLPDGSWTGMVGMVHRGEADIGLGLFTMTPIRHTVVDFTHPASIVFSSTFAARGNPEVDPWSFFLPYTTFVWVSIPVTVLGLVTFTAVFLSCLPLNKRMWIRVQANATAYIRVLLQQDIYDSAGWWWWERVVLGVWMLMTLVLTKSYAGNLVSQLAVRYVPQPLQTLEDLLQSSATVIIYQGTSTEQAFKTAEGGLYRDIWSLRLQDRIQFITASDVPQIPDMVKQTGAAFINMASLSKLDMSYQFSKTGKCEFYIGRGGYIASLESLAVAKGSPLHHTLSRKVMEVTESGLFDYWYRMYNPNLTICLNSPTKYAINSAFAIRNIWGMFVVLGGGGVASLLVFCLELLYFHLSH